MFSKNRKLINKSKQKINIGENSLGKATISSLDSFNKKKLSVPISIVKKSDPKNKNINIVIISVDICNIVYYLNKAQMFIVLIKDIQYQVKKETRAETSLRSNVSQEYYNFRNIFSKKNLDTFFLY